MIMDGARELVMGDFRRKCRQAGVHVRQTEPHTPFSNAAESAIRELKKGVARQMVATKAPKVLWDHCVEREAMIRSNTAHAMYQLNGQVPETMVNGETPAITTIAEFGWCEWVKFRDTAISFPEDPIVLGRDLGPAIDIGPAYTRKILKANGQVVYTSTVRSVTPDELKHPDKEKARARFDEAILEKLGEPTTWQDLEDDPELDTPLLPAYQDADGGTVERRVEEDDIAATPDTIDTYVGAEVFLPTGDGSGEKGRVKQRKRDSEGRPIGTANPNPILDTRVYTVEFPNGKIGKYAANIIAEHMYSVTDTEGNHMLLLNAIVGHRKDGHALERADMYVYNNGRRSIRKTTKGWQLCIEWRDGSTTWERLTDVKGSHPTEAAEYAIAHNLQKEPAFAWWVLGTINRRNRIIAALKKRTAKKNEKFGIKIPRNWKEAVKFDKANGDTKWQDAIRQEMTKVLVAFKIMAAGEEIPPGYQQIRCHMIFDLKIEDFRRKTRLVAGGHMTETPSVLTYSSVVSRESVRIALILAALNALQVKTSDIENAYLTAPAAEKVWCVLGPEFGPDAVKRAIITRSLYGLKSAGAAFRNHLADCMRHLGWTSCLADPDVWFKEEVRPSDGFKYYAYALLYVDDALMIHHDAEGALRAMDHYFKMKPGSIGSPDFYLGAKLRPTVLPNGVEAWAMSASKYIQGAVMNLRKYLKENGEGRTLPKRASNPFPQSYRPEIDVSEVLRPDWAAFYQSLIGILRWCVELGRVDIITEVSMLASHLAMPRDGHLEASLHIFAYLEEKHSSRIVFDPTYPEIDHSRFKECDWRALYGDAKEAIPPNAPEPRGKEVDLRLFVDSDHAGDLASRRSRTGFYIFLNMAPIVWFSKRQPTIESSVFGAEFVAMKNGMETARGLRYKLCMMGVPLSGPTLMYGDNMSVIYNTQRPESTLKKKSNSIC